MSVDLWGWLVREFFATKMPLMQHCRRYFSAELNVEKSGQLAALRRAKQVSRLRVAAGLSRVLGEVLGARL